MSVDVGLVGGDLPLVTQHITGSALTLQRVMVSIGIGIGENRERPAFGLPHEEWIALRVKPVGEIVNLVRDLVESRPGVLRVEEARGALLPNGDGRGVMVINPLRVVIPEEGAVSLFVDLFGTGQGTTETTYGLPVVSLVSPPLPSGNTGTSARLLRGLR